MRVFYEIAQMKHLEERVLVHIFERFKYIPSEEDNGVCFLFDNEE